MWFTDSGGLGGPPAIGEITLSGVITESSTSSDDFGPAGLATGSDGDLWFSGANDASSAGEIAKLPVGAPPASAAPPVVTGSDQEGSAQSCDGAVWSDWAGQQPSLTADSFDGYQWLLDGSPISGATASSYTPLASDVDHQLSCKVTVTYTLFPTTVSATSAAVTVLPDTVPGPPLTPTAIAGDGEATVSWVDPASDGGSSISSYTVTAADSTTPTNGGQTCAATEATATSCAVTDLTNGDSYTFTVTATNGIGTGPHRARRRP